MIFKNSHTNSESLADIPATSAALKKLKYIIFFQWNCFFLLAHPVYNYKCADGQMPKAILN